MLDVEGVIKNHRVCADSQGQRQNRDDCESGRLAQLAEDESQVQLGGHGRSSGDDLATMEGQFESQSVMNATL
jgi:hypothetical protein